jgi:hypothetical protein
MNVAGFRHPRPRTSVKTNSLISFIPLALIASASARADTLGDYFYNWSDDLQWIHPAKGIFDDARLVGLRANIMF